MNRFEFLAALSAKLSDLSPSDRRRVTDFYSEMIDDRIEEGLTEEEAIESFGDPENDAREMLEELRKTGKLEPEAAEAAMNAGAEEEKSEGAGQERQGEASSMGLSEEAIDEAIKNIMPEEPVQVLSGVDVARRTRRKLVPSLILTFVGIAIAVMIVLRALNIGGYLLSFFPGGERTERHVIEQEISAIHVDVSSADIRIVDSGTSLVRVNVPKAARNRYTVSVENGTLTVRSGYSFRRYLPFVSSGSIEIALPAAAKAAGGSYVLDSLLVETSSGDVNVYNEIPVKDAFSIKTSSGDVRVEGDNLPGIVSENLSIETSSGDVRLDDLMVKNLEISTSSGDVSSSDVRVSGFDISTSSGEIDFYEARQSGLRLERFTVTSSSGDVKIKLDTVPHILTETVSGDEKVEACKTSLAYTENYVIRTTSGDITVESLK